MDLTLDDTERKLMAALGKLPWHWKARLRTRSVKNGIGAVGEKLGFTVHAASCTHEANCEWLYDLCWCDEEGGPSLAEMPLAVECEWNSTHDALCDDFDKLLVSRANHRVFICSHTVAEDWVDCTHSLIGRILRYKGTTRGDRYLFGNWTAGGWQFGQYVHPTKVPTIERAWLFQATGDYVLLKELKRRKRDDWRANKYLAYLHPGNIILLWQAGKNAGIYGIGKLTSEPHLVQDEMRVDVQYRGLLKETIFKSKLLERQRLKNMQVIQHPRGTNFRVTDKEWQALKKAFPEIASAARG